MSTTISTRLVSLRKEKNLSQKDAALALGISQALLSHYEKGIRECGLDFLCKAASFYDVSADYLLGRSDTRLSSDTLFELETVPGDDELKMKTIFRAAAMLHEKMSGLGNAYSDKIRMVYVLTIYKVYLCAIKQEYFLQAAELHLEVTPYLSASMLDYVLTTITSKGDRPKKSEPMPVCVDTVISEAIRLIEDQIQSIYNISQN